MQESMLYDLMLKAELYNYRDKLEKEDCLFKSDMLKEKKRLTDVLDDEKIKLLNIFVANHQNYLDSFNEPIIVRVLNQGIKIGMQIQEAFNEFEAT